MFGTLGADFSSEDRPLQRADVALHCGDLTASSKRTDFRTSLEMLKSREAPLKLVIAGNHDFTMDHAVERRVAEAVPHLGPKLLARDYGTLREARKLFADAKDAGIVFLDEGTECSHANNLCKSIYAFSTRMGLSVRPQRRLSIQCPRGNRHRHDLRSSERDHGLNLRSRRRRLP